MNWRENIVYNTIKYFIMAMLIVTGISIPLVFWRRGDFIGRVFAAFWGLLVVAGAAWITTKGLGYMWRRRGRRKNEG